MKKIYVQLYAFIVTMIMIITVCVFVFKILEDSEKGKANANIAFGKFAKAVIAETQTSVLNSEEYKIAVFNYAKQLDIKNFSIIFKENNILISHGANAENGSNSFAENAPSRFFKQFKGEATITVDGNTEKVFVSAIINVLSSEIIFVRSRSVFVTSLIILLLTIILLVFQYIKPDENRIYAEVKDKSIFKHKCDTQTAESDYENKMINSQNTVLTETVPQNMKNDKITNLDDLDGLNIYKNDYYGLEHISDKPEENQNKLNNLNEEASNTDFKIKEQSIPNIMPEGLYSPLTGLGWQEYLIERLDAEIGRAASSDQDISFIIIKLNNVNLKQIKITRISELLTDTFKFRDMIFEYGENGFAGILQDASLEDAMRVSGNIFSGLQAELEFQIQNPLIAIGITSRTYRLISAARMIEEAEAAVLKAGENNADPIVAFRANPDKYRNFVANTEKENLNYPSI